MSTQPSLLIGLVRAIDRFTAWTGWCIAWLILPLVATMTYEVIARYAFARPTIWAYDLSYMLYGSLFMLGAAYALLKGAHIRTDLLWANFSSRTKGWIDLIAYLGFFFPGLIMLFVSSLEGSLYSYSIGERSELTAWRPLIWPFKAVVPVATVLLLFQGVSEVLKSVHAVRTGETLGRHEATEI